MRRWWSWIMAGASFLGLAMVLLAIGFAMYDTYIACESMVPHIPCAKPDFVGLFGSAGIIAPLGVFSLLVGFLKRERAKRAVGSPA
jgi:hypothetical protein